ncbi:hypothetical protein GCM10010495_13340 [Kitasatospora herbaricolor]|uniref:hypothetical protein n=1 Tax=Kitasatospora herbaricolor TaxID=68217 RepID=UPI00174BA427|nr:hypothetical protein [Kitasatospora herbaricolor]MDQ0309143.1 transcriptional regulator with XRE-family HTH domain [Kitasatospora herbaricolor]GGV03299.1 hypothetical protein GCM10010495_13340 [Kitasatospora herbaricolor]
MTQPPGFGAMLAWLLDHRGLDAEALADRAGSTADEIRGVVAGEPPGEGLLRRLAPALGLRALDLFILAGPDVPEDLAPVDATAARGVRDAVLDALRLPAAGRQELLRFIRSLPQQERSSAFAPKRLTDPAGGPGARLVRMLQYRNLDWSGMAYILAFVTPTYLSTVTYGSIGAGHVELTPRLVTDFAALLGMDARDLAGLTGVELPEVPPAPAPEAVDAAALLWEARRLSAAQARQVSELARSMRGDSRDGHRSDPSGR